MTVSTSATASTRSLVWGLAFTQTVGWGILFYSFPVLLGPMQADLGWTRGTLVGGFALATVLSGAVAPVIGRHLDRNRSRSVMTVGSLLAAVLVAAWSQATTPISFYVIWACLGVVQAGVLYDAAFSVIVQRTAPHHAGALLTVTLTAGMASFVFQPLTSEFVLRYGWRTTLLLLAVLLGAATAPVHAMVLRAAGAVRPPVAHAAPPRRLAEAVPGFWGITVAFALVTMTSFSIVILLITYLVDHAWTLPSAAFAAGTLGAMQLPGRLVFSRITGHVPNRQLAPCILGLPAVGVALLLVSDGSALVWPAIAVLGTGQGALTLFKATLLVDLYGTDHFGRLNGISAFPVTVARALAPLAATVIATRHGYGPAFLTLITLSAGGAWLAHGSVPSDGEGRVGDRL